MVEIEKVKAELGEYIGEENIFNYSCLLITDRHGKIVDVQIQNFDTYLPMEAFFPKAESELEKEGESTFGQ